MLHPAGLFLPFEAVSVAAVGIGTAGLALFLGRRFLVNPDEKTADGQDSSSIGNVVFGSGAERRTTPRRRGSSVAAQLAVASDLDPIEVWVVDRSLGGLCLLSDTPVDNGSRLRVRPCRPADQPWTQVRVRSCNHDREGWTVHCQFLHVPPMNVLLLFG
jgi:hypothetical protein